MRYRPNTNVYGSQSRLHEPRTVMQSGLVCPGWRILCSAVGRRRIYRYRGLNRVTKDSGATSNSSAKKTPIQSLTIRH